jgi:tetratricopeptide (TPR) repeat protein
MSAGTPERAAALIDRLLLVDRISELPAVLRQDLPVSGDELLATLDQLAGRRAAGGRAAEAELLRFLRPLVEQALPEWARGRPQDPIEAALARPHPFALLALIRRDAALRTPETLQRTREMLIEPRVPQAQAERYAYLHAVLGRFADQRSDRVQSRTIWSAALRRRGDLGRARFHAERALGEAQDTDRTFPLATLAAIQGATGDLDGRIATTTESLAGLQGLPRVALYEGLAADLRSLGRTREALDNVAAALEVMGADPILDESRYRLVNLRGLLHEDIGEYEYGLAAFEEAIAIAVRMGDRGGEFEASTNRAASLLKAGRTRAGRRAFERIHQTVLRWGATGGVAASLNNLAAAALQDDDLDAAAAYYSDSLAMRAPDEYSRGAAYSLFGIGDVLSERGGAETAIPMYLMAYETGARAGAGEETAILLAARLAQHGADSPETEDMLRRLSDGMRGGSYWRGRQETAMALATYLADHGRAPEAVGVLRDLLTDAQRLGPRPAADVRRSLARHLAKDPAGRGEAFTLLWSVRSDLMARVTDAGDPARRAEIVGESIGVYEALIDLLLDAADVDGGPVLPLPDDRDAVELAFDLHEEARSRTFLAELADLAVPMPVGVPAGLAAREADLVAERRRLLAGLPQLGGWARRKRLDDLGRLAGRLGDVHREIATHAPEYARLRQGRPVTLAILRELLDEHAPAEGMLLVSYFCGHGTTTYFAVEPGGVLRSYRVPLGTEKLTGVIDRLRITFNGDARDFPPVPPLHPRRPQRRSLAFYEELGPQLLRFTDLLPGRALLCVAPHGPLHLAPLHALPDGTGARLAERVAVTYTPSLSLLAHVLSRPVRRPRTALVAAVAAREDPDPNVFEQDAAILRAAGWPVTDLHGPDATPRATLGALGRHEIAHVTCHGYVDDSSPRESGLVLSDGDRPTKLVGALSIVGRRAVVLRAEDLAVALPAVRLLTLRACSSAWQSSDHRGDEFTGLNRALLRGGAAATLAALWNVDQHSSAEFLRWVYERWRGGVPLWVAVWDAQRRALADADRTWMRHPYHWAPLVLTGDWR